MQICLEHGTNDSGSKCSGGSSPQSQSQGSNRRNVAFRLSARGAPRDCGASYAGRVSRALAHSQAASGGTGHRRSDARGTGGAMIVLDPSAAVDWLLQTPAGQRIEKRIYARQDTLHSVHLLDVEFAQVLRRLVREGTLTSKRAGEAIEDLAALRIRRYPPVLLLQRIWRLRQNLSAYDAAYVALAEELQAPLITRDQRIAAAPGHAAAVEVF